MSNTKRPSLSPQPPVSGRPVVGGSVRPGNVRDALTEAQAIAGGGLQRKASLPPAVQQGRKTVLLVDDDAAVRARVREALSPFYDVIEARDGMEAAEMCSTIQPPAMIVSEVVMPRVDGFTFAKILRGNPVMKRVPIMFYSSRNTPQDVTQALGLGACQYVVKATPVSELVSKIRKIVA